MSGPTSSETAHMTCALDVFMDEKFWKNLDLVDVAMRLGIEKPRVKGKWSCPSCGSRDNLHIYPQPERGSYCYGCGKSFDAPALVMAAQGCSFKEALQWLGGDQKWEPAKPKSKPKKTKGPDYSAIFDRLPVPHESWRGLSPMTLVMGGVRFATADQFRIAADGKTRNPREDGEWSEWSDFAVFSYPNTKGVTPWLKYRALCDSEQRWDSTTQPDEKDPYLEREVRDHSGTLYLAEGEVDALSVWEVGCIALGFPGASTPDPSLSVLDQFDTIVIALDPDDTGRRATQQFIDESVELRGAAWTAERVRVLDLPDGQDLNSILVHRGPDVLRAMLGEYRHCGVDAPPPVISIDEAREVVPRIMREAAPGENVAIFLTAGGSKSYSAATTIRDALVDTLGGEYPGVIGDYMRESKARRAEIKRLVAQRNALSDEIAQSLDEGKDPEHVAHRRKLRTKRRDIQRRIDTLRTEGLTNSVQMSLTGDAQTTIDDVPSIINQLVLSPTHDLAAEFMEILEDMDVPVHHVEGRRKSNCARYAQYQDAERAESGGGSRYCATCPLNFANYDADAGETDEIWGGVQMPATACYTPLRTRPRKGAVNVATHAMAAMWGDLNAFSRVYIDENPGASWLPIQRITVEDAELLAGICPTPSVHALLEMMRTQRQAFERGQKGEGRRPRPVYGERLKERAGDLTVDTGGLGELVRKRELAGEKLAPYKDAIFNACKEQKTFSVELFAAIEAFNADTSGMRGNGDIDVVMPGRVPRFEDPTVFLLDATGIPEGARALLGPDVRVEQIKVRPNGGTHITLVRFDSYGMTDTGQFSPTTERRMKAVAKMVEHEGGAAVVFAEQGARAPLSALFGGADVDYYGSSTSRGSNVYKEHKQVVMLPLRVSEATQHAVGCSIDPTSPRLGEHMTVTSSMIQAVNRVRPVNSLGADGARHIVICAEQDCDKWWTREYPDAHVTEVNADQLAWDWTYQTSRTKASCDAVGQWFEETTRELIRRSVIPIPFTKGYDADVYQYAVGVLAYSADDTNQMVQEIFATLDSMRVARGDRDSVYYSIIHPNPFTPCHPDEYSASAVFDPESKGFLGHLSIKYSNVVLWLNAQDERDASRMVPYSTVKTDRGMVRVHHGDGLTPERARLWFDCMTDPPKWFELDGTRHWIAPEVDVQPYIDVISAQDAVPSLRALAELMGMTRPRLTRELKSAGVESVGDWISEQWSRARQPVRSGPRAADILRRVMLAEQAQTQRDARHEVVAALSWRDYDEAERIEARAREDAHRAAFNRLRTYHTTS